MYYLITAYRWGWTNSHHYTVGIVSDRMAACTLAKEACEYRGGKYGVVVEEWDARQHPTRVAYFPSMFDETEPHNNERIDMFESIGHAAHNAITSLAVWDAPASEGGPNIRRDIEAPDWLVDAVLEQETSCRFRERVRTRALNKPAVDTSTAPARPRALSPETKAALDEAWAESEAEAREVLTKALAARRPKG